MTITGRLFGFVSRLASRVSRAEPGIANRDPRNVGSLNLERETRNAGRFRRVLSRRETRFAGRLLALAAILLAGPVFAGGGGSSGAEFLRVPMGARASALGENFTGLADDVTAAAWNPAGLGQLKSVELSAMHLSYLADTSYEFIAGSVPAGRWGNLALSGVYMNMKPFDSTAPGSGAPKGTASDGMAALSWGGSFKPIFPGEPDYHSFYYGVTAKFIYRSLGGYQDAAGIAQTYTASAFAGDVGLFQQFTPEITWGVALMNLGSKITFLGDAQDSLPMAVRGGVGWRAFKNSWAGVLVLADFTKPMDSDGGKFKQGTWGGAGVEMSVWRILCLRGGFRAGPDGNRVVGGAGLSFAGISIDYAFVPLGDFGSGHRIGISARLGGGDRRLPAVKNLAAESLPQSKVMLRWEPVSEAVGYQVLMRKPGTADFALITPTPRQAPELPLKGLKGGAEYAFRVMAVDSDGKEGRPQDLVYSPPVEKVPLTAPVKATVLSPASRKAVLTWAPSAGATGYNVYYRRTGSGAKAWTKATKTPRTTAGIALNGLAGGVSYDFTVMSVDDAGKTSKGSKPVSIRVKP
jgi:hypothetical protein